MQENMVTYIQPTQDIKVTEVKGSFKRLKLIDVPGKQIQNIGQRWNYFLGAQHILEQIPAENWDQSVEKGGLDLGGPNGRFKNKVISSYIGLSGQTIRSVILNHEKRH